MPWLWRRPRSRPAKLKEGRPAAGSKRPGSHQHQQSSRPRRPGSSSSASMRPRERDQEKNDPFADPPQDDPFADPPISKEAGLPPATARDHITPLAAHPRLQHSPHLLPVIPQHQSSPYNLRPRSYPSLPSFRDRNNIGHRQSLRKDLTAESLVRRISSKRRNENYDQAREDKVRAMSLAMPQKRPAGSSGGMLRRESKKVKGGSDVSLPLQGSIHSSMSGNSERRAFRVSAFDMFSPRPTIRCSVGPQYYGERSSPNAYSEKPSREASRRERRPVSSREHLQSRRSSRIDDLADELDAGELREIMERDKRRRDKKARLDTERLRRKLERRAEKDRATEANERSRTPRPKAPEPVGLGIEREAPVPMEDVRPSTPPQPQRLEALPMTPTTQGNSQLPTPLESPAEEPVVSDARAIRYSRGNVFAPGHARDPSNVSQLPDLISERFVQETPIQSIEQQQDPKKSGSIDAIDSTEATSPSRRASIRRRSSDIRRMGVFASLFRRGKRASQDHGATSPSEASFSNTSRESMSRQPIPAHFVGPSSGPASTTTITAPPVPLRKTASTPKRTRSKFREDLPEYPVSPPDSRIQSPEAPTASAIAARRRTQTPPNLRLDSTNSPASNRSYSPTSPMPPVGNIMSQSLASIDSEASWLSGKPAKRASTKSYIRSSNGSTAVQPHHEHSRSYEELGMPDEEYFRRLTPQPEDPLSSTRSSDVFGSKANGILGVGAPGDDESVQHVRGRQPNIVHHEPRVVSAEGLVGSVHDAASSQHETSPRLVNVEPNTPDTAASESSLPEVQRAHSIDLGKHHARHLSAGSAKLLDIKRSSTQSVGTR